MVYSHYSLYWCRVNVDHYYYYYYNHHQLWSTSETAAAAVSRVLFQEDLACWCQIACVCNRRARQLHRL